MRGEFGQQVGLGLRVLLPHLHGALQALRALGDQHAVGEEQLEVDAFGILGRVDAAVNVEDRVVLERAHDVDERIRGAQRLQELA